VVLPALAGLGLFTIAIASSLSQPADCAQPNPDGCPLELNQPAFSVMNGDMLVHRWRVQAADGGDGTTSLFVTLPAPPVDFDLYVAREDGTLVARSIQFGPIDEQIALTGIPAGTYVIVVVSPRCEKSNLPYAVLVTGQAPVMAPFAVAEDLPPMAPDVATLLGGGLGSCAAVPPPADVVNPYGSPPTDVNPYGGA
jgi:hypothetical protein